VKKVCIWEKRSKYAHICLHESELSLLHVTHTHHARSILRLIPNNMLSCQILDFHKKRKSRKTSFWWRILICRNILQPSDPIPSIHGNNQHNPKQSFATTQYVPTHSPKSTKCIWSCWRIRGRRSLL
jgi:hypothetical protein